MAKRITFSEADAIHLYELALEHLVDGCHDCNNLQKRLETFIGPKNVKRVRKLIKDNGYCNRLQ